MTPRSRVPPGPGLCGHSLLCPQAESVAERELSAKGLQAHSSTREPLLFSQTSQNGGTGVPLPALLLSEVTPGSSIVTSGRVPVATVQPLSQRCCPYLSPVAASQPPHPILSRFSLPTSNPMVPLFESLPAVLPNYQVRNSFTGSFPMETDACSWCCVSQKQVGLTAQLLSDGGAPSQETCVSVRPVPCGPRAASRARCYFRSLTCSPAEGARVEAGNCCLSVCWAPGAAMQCRWWGSFPRVHRHLEHSTGGFRLSPDLSSAPGGRGSQLPPAFSCPLLFCCFMSGVLYVEDTATS